MKKLVGLTALIILMSLSINAQNNKRENRNNSQFTAEQSATLKAKKMALQLDLNEKQQKSIYKMMKKNAEERLKIREERQANRKDGTRPTQEQRFENVNLALDKQIAHKAEMKKILTPEQFDKWNKVRNKSMNNRKGRIGKKGNNRANRNCSCNNNFNRSSKRSRNKI